MELSDLIFELKSTSKPLEKIEIIREYDTPFLRFLLELTFNTDKQFHLRITRDQLPTPGPHAIEEYEGSIREMFAELLESQSPQINRETVMEKLELLNSGSQELLWGVLCKNLHCGLSTKGVNRAFPGLITETLVQLAHKFLPDKDYNFYGKTFGWSYKLDGLRCTAQRRDGKWKLISRKGKPIVTANHIIPDLEHLYNLTKFTFFDGELYKHGLKFETIQGNVMRRLDPHAAEGLEFRVFIAFDIESFEAKVTPRRWMTTFPSTDTVLPVSLGESISLSEIREHVTLIDTEGYPEVEKRYPESPIVRAISQGYEGIMLRSPLYPYDYKRSHALMKVKVMDSTDCKVLAVEGGSFPIIENGEQKEIVTLLKLVVLQPNGITCKPGTGFDLTFRRFWWEHADELVGKTVEIFHQGYGTDHRMRFPVFSRIREDK